MNHSTFSDSLAMKQQWLGNTSSGVVEANLISASREISPGYETDGRITQSLPHGGFVMKRKRLRHIAHRQYRYLLDRRLPEQPSPSLASSNPVSIFMVIGFTHMNQENQKSPAWNAEVYDQQQKNQNAVRSRADGNLCVFRLSDGSLPPIRLPLAR